MEQIEGQMDIFDFLKSISENSTNHPDNGKSVFIVILGDVMKVTVYQVIDDRYFCTDGDGYTVFYSDAIGNSVFFSEDEARKKAQSNLKELDFISAEEIERRTVKVKGFDFIRSEDGKNRHGFYAVLDNGYVYMDIPPYYDHIAVMTEKQADEALNNSVSRYKHEQNDKCSFKNMYKCNFKGTQKKGEWLFSEATFAEKLNKEYI